MSAEAAGPPPGAVSGAPPPEGGAAKALRAARALMARPGALPALKILGVAAFFCLPLAFRLTGLATAPYWLGVLNNVGISAILALSLNVILGHAGMFNMGHAAFFALGAYTTGVLNTVCGWPIFATLPVAGLAAGLFAYIAARPIIHLRGDYLLIVTIGIVEIIRIALINNVFGLTGGPNGIFGISRPQLFGFKIALPFHFFYLIWLSVALTALVFHFLERSRFGRALKFIKEDTVAAEGIGVNTSRLKILAFTIGAVFAGFAGTLYAAQMGTISPESFTFAESVMLFTIVILGGSGSQKGVILGAFLVMGLPEVFRGFQNYRLLVFGAALVLMMIFRPQGLLPPKAAEYQLPPPWDKFQSPPGQGGPNGSLGAPANSNGLGGAPQPARPEPEKA